MGSHQCNIQLQIKVCHLLGSFPNKSFREEVCAEFKFPIMLAGYNEQGCHLSLSSDFIRPCKGGKTFHYFWFPLTVARPWSLVPWALPAMLPLLPLLLYPAIMPGAQGHTRGCNEHQQQQLASGHVPLAARWQLWSCFVLCHMVRLLTGCLFVFVLLWVISPFKLTLNPMKTTHHDSTAGKPRP